MVFEEILELVARKRDSLETVMKQGPTWMNQKLLKIFNFEVFHEKQSGRHNSVPEKHLSSKSLL